METHHLYHLAANWGKRAVSVGTGSEPPPLTTGPVQPKTTSTPIGTEDQGQRTTAPAAAAVLAGPNTTIRAAAAQMVFANRASKDFITPDRVVELEYWTGQVRGSSWFI